MKVKWEIAKLICTDDKTRLYRWVNSFVQMVETVSHNGFCRFTQRISSFHTTDLAVSHNGFHGIRLPTSRQLVADFTATSCGFTHNRLRFYS